MPDSPPQHFAHTSQPEQAPSNPKTPNQETPPAASPKETDVKSAQGTPENKAQPPGGNKQLFAAPSYLLNLKY